MKGIQHDEIKSPAHYQLTSGWEAKDVLKLILTKEEYRGWLIGSALKYIMRYKQKGDPIKDISKAKQFMEFTIEDLEQEVQRLSAESLVDD